MKDRRPANELDTVAFRVHVLRGLNKSRAKDPHSEETQGWKHLLKEQDIEAYARYRKRCDRYSQKVDSGS